MFKKELGKEEFFDKMDELGLALTFDDVTVITGYSKVMPSKVSLETRFSKNVSLKIPIVSAAMDTVTEYKLAIELAKLGGIGVIHRNLTPEEQAYQVARVKNHLNGLTGLIKKPICVYQDERVQLVLNKIRQKDYPFKSFPVLNREGKLVGIVTGNDFDFCEDSSVEISKIMTKDVISANEGTTFDEAYKKLWSIRKKVLPLVNDKGEIVGLYTSKDLKAIKSGETFMYNIDERGQLRVAAAIGVGDEALKRLEKLVEEKVDVVVIDTAHGDSENVIDTLKKTKKEYASLDIVVGNISGKDSAERFIKEGVDGIKVGQGPGSICTTRIVAGVGLPQITAIYNCYVIANKYDIPICADGGLRFSGDIVKAIVAGADSVMMGGMLAGTEEAPGESTFKEGRIWKKYRGMGSIEAMESHQGSRERYLQQDEKKLVPEGVESLVPYKGKLSDVIYQDVGGLRSGMGYVGASNIKELKEKGLFKRVSASGQIESHPHDVEITEEPPNYSLRRL